MKLLTQFWRIILLLMIAGNALSNSPPASFDNFTSKRFLKRGTFGLALSPTQPKGLHRIVAYIPHGTLVFDHPTQATKTIGGKSHRGVVTQFGHSVCVLASEVSTRKFTDAYGAQNVIFHQDAYMCPPGQMICDEGAGQDIRFA